MRVRERKVERTETTIEVRHVENENRLVKGKRLKEEEEEEEEKEEEVELEDKGTKEKEQ